MNINIYYGGRGLIEDPTLHVLEKMEKVFEELNVVVKRYNLFENKNTIVSLPQSLKEADGVILAASVEWMGIGGLLTEFLDACWLYGDKERIGKVYMQPVVLATAYGEREAMLTLRNAWSLLGGISCEGIEAYVEDTTLFLENGDYSSLIERRAEDLYRAISKKIKNLPSSFGVVKQNLLRETLSFTPQESEQLSRYVADDIYVKKQKEDIEELATMFKGLLSDQETDFSRDLGEKFLGKEGFSASYSFMIEDRKKDLYIEVKDSNFSCVYEKREDADVMIKISNEVLSNIIKGRLTFQRAFMTGEMKAKGNFKTLRMLDELFKFD